MRLGKRNFRHRMRYGFQPFFSKRGDRIVDPFSIPMRIEGEKHPWQVYTTDKLSRAFKTYKREYMLRFGNWRYRRVASTHLPNGIRVSTVCLMLNHAFTDPAVPIIFETMVFASSDCSCDMDSMRYSTLSDAKKGHHKMVMRCRKINLKQQENLSEPI